MGRSGIALKYFSKGEKEYKTQFYQNIFLSIGYVGVYIIIFSFSNTFFKGRLSAKAMKNWWLGNALKKRNILIIFLNAIYFAYLYYCSCRKWLKPWIPP